jgi:phosphinothricin acetyltransferase
MQLRPIRPADYEAILTLWNREIASGISTFSSTVHTCESLTALVAHRMAAHRPFLIVESAGAVLGFATYDQFRASNGYRISMEHSVLLAPEAQGQGIGTMLMGAIEEHARQAGHHMMIAGISGENLPAIAFHSALGYSDAGRIVECARKFDRWFDLVLMQKRL